MSEMVYVSPNGVVIDLVKPGDWSRRIAYAGVSGLVGAKTSSPLTAVNVPGQVPVGFRTTEMKGTLMLQVVGGPSESVDALVSEVNREFVSDAYGTLVLSRESAPRLNARVRLDGAIDFPKSFLDSGDCDAEVGVPVICDDGYWATDVLSGADSVTVTNPGDVLIWPSIVWKGAGSVALPSGAVVTLPNAPDWRRLSLDPYTSHEVTDMSGTVDEPISDATAQLSLGEGVPQRQSRTYLTEGQVRLEWKIGYLNPWR